MWKPMGNKLIRLSGTKYRKDMYDFDGELMLCVSEKKPSTVNPNGIHIVQWFERVK
jgi:hypothetical protein